MSMETSGNLNSCGVYQIECAETGTIYIGSTTCTFRRRWTVHKSRLRHGQHRNRHLQHAWDKYGGGSFEFSVLERVDDVAQAVAREQQWLNLARNNGVSMFNIALIAQEPNTGRSLSPEHRARISRARQGYKHTKAARQRMSVGKRGNAFGAKSYPEFHHRDTGEVILPGTNLKALCQAMDLPYRTMHKVATGEKPSCKGWKLKEK